MVQACWQGHRVRQQCGQLQVASTLEGQPAERQVQLVAGETPQGLCAAVPIGMLSNWRGDSNQAGAQHRALQHTKVFE